MNPIKFVVYGVPRVGSNFFISQLNRHPDILCHYEIFHRHAIYNGFEDKPERSHWLEAVSLQERDASPEKFLARLFAEHHGYTHIGYNLFPGQNDAVLQYSIADSSQKKVILKRKNILDNYISLKVAVKTGVWSSKAAKEKGVDERILDKHVRFEQKEFVQHVRKVNLFYNNIETNISFRQNESLIIYYEDLLEDRQAVLNQVYDFLGVERIMVSESTVFEKQNKEGLRELVSNYSELMTFLSEEYYDFFPFHRGEAAVLATSKNRQNVDSVECKKKLNTLMPQDIRYRQAVKIDIHIGMEKTGTSSIQAALMQARKNLCEVGILFPKSLNIPNNTYLATAFQSEDKSDTLRIVSNVVGKESVEHFRKRLLLDFGEELGSSDCLRVVVSSEHLSSRLTMIEEIKRLKEFFARFGSEISIYLYLRPQDEFCISHYSTRIKFVDETEPFVFPPLETIRDDLFYDRLLDQWVSVFGREHVHIRTYERTALAGADVVKDFWQWLQLPENILPSVNERNLSLDVKKLAFMGCFNNYVPRFINGKLNQMRGDIVMAMDAIESMGRKIAVSEKERADFLELFEEGNRKVATEYFGRDWLFTPRFANMQDHEQSEVADETLTADDAVKISAALWQWLQAKLIKNKQQIANLRATIADLNAKNERFKERNDTLTSSIDAVARYSLFRNPFKKLHAYKILMKSYRHGKSEQQ